MASILTNQNICYNIKDKKSLIEVEKALYTLFYRVPEMMGTPSILSKSKRTFFGVFFYFLR